MREDLDAPEERTLLEQRNRDLEQLLSAQADLAAAGTVGEVADRLLGHALSHLDSEVGAVVLSGEDSSLRLALARGLPEERVPSFRIEAGQGISGYLVGQRERLRCDDVDADPRFRDRLVETEYGGPLIGVPLEWEGRVLGAVHVSSPRSGAAYETRELELLERLAGFAAITFHHARRFQSLLSQSRRDALTGLVTHSGFWSSLQSEIKRARRHRRELGVVILDLEGLAHYSEEHGHLGGERALVQVADILSRQSRISDCIARFGGKRFSAILPETDAQGSAAFARKMCQAVGEQLSPRPEQLGLSGGVAAYPRHADFPRGLVQAAEEGLEHAKALGGHHICTRDMVEV